MFFYFYWRDDTKRQIGESVGCRELRRFRKEHRSLEWSRRGSADPKGKGGSDRAALEDLIFGRLFRRLGRRGNRRGFHSGEHRVRRRSAVVEDGQGDRGDHENDCGPSGQPGQNIGSGARSKGGLRSLAAEGAGEVSRAALLKQDNADQEEAHKDVYRDDEVKKNVHALKLLSAACSRLPG